MHTFSFSKQAESSRSSRPNAGNRFRARTPRQLDNFRVDVMLSGPLGRAEPEARGRVFGSFSDAGLDESNPVSCMFPGKVIRAGSETVSRPDRDSMSKLPAAGYPEKTGLYDPAQEKDSCGVGLVADIKGRPSHQIMLDAFHVNSRMDHRGGCGFE
ncbi:MAG: hypothetical protein F4Z20_09945, partial [Gammaproteobacteria bacterium]|nr:hypothetical protein [Gammaproteobacteria bacterium]